MIKLGSKVGIHLKSIKNAGGYREGKYCGANEKGFIILETEDRKEIWFNRDDISQIKEL